MELLRFHETTVAVREAAAANPLATFTEFNQFALLSAQEFKQVLVQSFGNETFDAAPLPASGAAKQTSVDWSSHKCNPPVANQGSCGSCWAFSTVGTVEAAHCIATGDLVALSEQQVVSCSTNGGSMGCNGGFPPSAIDWMQQGVCLETDWPYTAQTGACNKTCQKVKLSIGKTITTSGEASLETALNSQPVTVVVEAGNNVWRNYKSGVVTQYQKLVGPSMG
ncbi:papaya proteinase 4 [Aphanomyces invadans]|uniref:Papaya proteinase 4 n=1 Tax=Aphanomyces invadans TaxID=157072 RepID=A0A024TAZ6_9STRA|nr:papaya proteinase 4 [Aphanomyces invadans]ETV90497.1 papaya proteinase 4 [Aphanomyces invadans]|eukprot:XP_008880885.1 papaya proteinase 4 [Aphanomyces invadans]